MRKYLFAIFSLAAALQGQTFSQDVDAKMEQIRSTYNIPGASIAVTYEGRLIYTRGYGLADQEAGTAASPTTLFRIASVSKSLTALAILKLVEQGALSLDDRAFTILSDLQPIGVPDTRLADITVRQLLQHTSGMGNYANDPMFAGNQTPLADVIASNTGDARPVECASIIRNQMGQPLANTPGASYYYSNFGYCVLGRIIERRSGMGYEQYLRRHVLGPIAVQRMQVGRTLLANRAPGEARYYLGAGDTPANGLSVFPPHDSVPRQYGAFYLESFDSMGGWLANAVDLARVVSRIDPLATVPVVNSNSMGQIIAPPNPAPVPDFSPGLPNNFYGLGFEVDLVPNLTPLGNRITHSGSLAGTRSYVTRLASRLGLVVLFNSRHGAATQQDIDMIRTKVHVELVNILVNHRIAGTLPAGDQFPTFHKPAIASANGVRSDARLDWNRLSPGMHFLVRGTNLGPVVRRNIEPVDGVLPTGVDGIRVTVGGLNAPIRYVSATEIGAVVPFGVTAGTRPVVVISGDEQSTAANVTVSAQYPVLYSTNGTGGGLALVVKQNGTLHNTSTNKLAAGETVAVFLTGGGPTTPASVDGAIAPVCKSGTAGWGYDCLGGTPANPVPVGTVTARIGTLNAPVVYAGNAPKEAAGKTVVLLTVPAGITGKQSISVTLAGVVTKDDISVVLQ